MKQITRTVELDALRDLVQAPSRAYLAYVADSAPEAVRVKGWLEGGRWLVRLPADVSLEEGTRVVLLLDDGEFYFELRGVRVRGRLHELENGAREVVPEKIVTWDYGSMRAKQR